MHSIGAREKDGKENLDSDWKGWKNILTGLWKWLESREQEAGGVKKRNQGL